MARGDVAGGADEARREVVGAGGREARGQAGGGVVDDGHAAGRVDAAAGGGLRGECGGEGVVGEDGLDGRRVG